MYSGVINYVLFTDIAPLDINIIILSLFYLVNEIRGLRTTYKNSKIKYEILNDI